MRTKKRLQDLTIKDNFMFCAVMSEEENCTRFLEMVLGFPILKIDVSYTRNSVYHPEYKGLRVSIYELLEDIGTISDKLQEQINELSDVKQLKKLHKLVAKSESIEAFGKRGKSSFVFNYNIAVQIMIFGRFLNCQ